jgi:hypothetical protein
VDTTAIHNDVWEKAVAPAFKEANGLLIRDRPAFPDDVLHFTSAAALVSILSNKTLRVSRARASNDPKELDYGIRLIKDELGKSGQDDWDIVFYDEIVASFEGKLTDGKEVRHLDPHICCFTEAETAETVAHWAMYGRDGAGFALKFKAQALDDLKDVGLVQVTYEERHQRDLIRDALKIARQAAQAAFDYATATYGGDFWPKRSFMVASHGFGGVLSLLAATMKAKEFRAETEWRLLHAGRVADAKGQEDTKLKMGAEAKGSIIRTYFDIPFKADDLVSVTVGPVHADLNRPVVKRLLEHHDFTNTIVEVGTVALRTLA